MASKFMSKYNWIVDWPRVRSLPLMQVRATDTCCLDLNDYIIVTTIWAIYFTNFNAMRLG
jgi:hypothetical protein